MEHESSGELNNTVLGLDVVVTIVTFLCAFITRTLIPGQGIIDFYSHLFLVPLLLLLIISSLTWFGGYESPNRTTIVKYSWAVARAVTLACVVMLSLLFFLKIQYVSRFVIIVFAGLEFIFLVLVRVGAVSYFKQQVRSGSRILRVLIVGTRGRARELFDVLQEQIVWGVKVVGLVDPDPQHLGSEAFGIPIIGTVENFDECLKENVIDKVIVAIPRSLLDDAEPIVMACEEEGIRLSFMADMFNVHVARISLTMMREIPLLTLEPVAQDHQQLLAKRFLDFTLTLLITPFLIPLFLLVAVAVKLDSPGPIFFVQQRVGLRKHLFPMFKFRTMHIDAEAKLNEIEHLNEAEGPIFKMANDPRVTRVGRFLRRYSIDEMPQFINVLRGEMSLVGPRPMSIRDVELFDRGIQRKRFSVQPGITCLWQISGRSNLPFERWLELDLEYIENWSFSLDLKILLKTIPAVLFSRGAL